MNRKWVVFLLLLVVLFEGFSSASASPPAKILSGAVSNVLSVLVKWLWSLQQSPSKSSVSTRSMMKFESGYTVETVFDGSKLGIEPHSVEVSPGGDLLLLDSQNSNLYKLSYPLSRYSRPRLLTGSPDGYTGHVDGKLREARMSHPKGLTVDDRGNIYIADTMNMAIRKISESGVSTIAGGKWSRGGGHVDGPSEDAKFSDDFDLVYVSGSCSLLVVDRGNQAIREIQLHDDDCSHNHEGSFHLGIAVLVAAGFFGYMLALLQLRVKALFSSQDDLRAPVKKVTPVPPYQAPPKSVRPPLIPPEDEFDTAEEEGFFSSFGRLVVNTGSSVADIFTGIFSGFKRKPRYYQLSQQQQQQQHLYNKRANAWQMQESFAIPDGDEPPPPPLETRTPPPKRTYPFVSKEMEKNQHFSQSQGQYSAWGEDNYHQQSQQRQMQHQHQQHHHRHYSSDPHTYYEKSCETNEIVFGAVQEQDGRREAMVIKAVDYGDPRFDHRNIRPRINYRGYSHGY